MLLHLVKSLINITAKIGLPPKDLLTNMLITNKCKPHFPSNVNLLIKALCFAVLLYITFAGLKGPSGCGLQNSNCTTENSLQKKGYDRIAINMMLPFNQN